MLRGSEAYGGGFHLFLGSDSAAGRPLLRGAATLDDSSVPHGHESVSGSPGPTGPSLAPFAEGRVLPGIRTVPALSRLELCGSPLCPGARVGSDARPTLALSAGDNRRQACGPSGRMSVPLRVGLLAVHKGGVTSLRVSALTGRCPPAEQLPVGTAPRAPPSSAFPGA